MASISDMVVHLNQELVDEINRLRGERNAAARLVRRLLRSHGEKYSYRSVSSRAAAGLWLAHYDSRNPTPEPTSTETTELKLWNAHSAADTSNGKGR